MRIHLIAVGGAIMHNLAIALKNKGFEVSGSDDEIFEPSASRLAAKGLLPPQKGWFPEKIDSSLDAVILGMHARADNPELLRAEALNIPVFSFPAYIFEQSKHKLRVVIAGSHGKTTITAMVMHCLNYWHKAFDYLAGAQLEGFDTMVQLSDAPLMIIEGDEYFASPLDRRPKFLLYKAQIVLISGIAWDHYNVFPTWDSYLDTFRQLCTSMHPDDKLIYFEGDENIARIADSKAAKTPYCAPDYFIEDERVKINFQGRTYAFGIFGKHNMQNLEGAKKICFELGIGNAQFYEAMQSFKGAARRLEVIKNSAAQTVFRDFAHSPSKVKATVDAVKEQYGNKKLIACLELHTFSSLNKGFIHLYENTMKNADEKIVYFNPHTLELKKLPPLSAADVKKYFNDEELIVLNDSEQLALYLKGKMHEAANILLMSSGNFDNLHFDFLK